MVALCISLQPLVRAPVGLEPLGDIGHEISDAAGISPLVVVPGDHLEEVAAEVHRGAAIDDRGVWVAAEVRGDQRLLGVLKNALQLALGGLAQRTVDLRLAGGFGDVSATRSMTETVIVGTRSEKPSNLPFSSGMTR